MTSNVHSVFDGEPCYGCGKPLEPGEKRIPFAIRSGDSSVALAAVHPNNECQAIGGRRFSADLGPGDRGDWTPIAEEAVRTGTPPPPFRVCYIWTAPLVDKPPVAEGMRR